MHCYVKVINTVRNHFLIFFLSTAEAKKGNFFLNFSYKRSDDFLGNALPEDTKLDQLNGYKSEYQTLKNDNGDLLTTELNLQDEKEVKNKSHKETINQNGTASNTTSYNSNNLTSTTSLSPDECSNLVQTNYGIIKKSVLYSPFGFLFRWTSSWEPGNLPFYSLLFAIFTATLAVVMLIFGFSLKNQPWYIILLIVFILLTLAFLCFISCFVQDGSIQTFKVE